MTNLRDHFRAMQAMAERFLTPGEYIDRNGDGFERDVGKHKAFTYDMLHMLDSPEQREAEKAEDDKLFEAQLQLGDAQSEIRTLRDLLAVEQTDKGRAIAELDVVKDENNDLRSRLMASELAHARLQGYVERVEDERPPVMVPEKRPRFIQRGETRGSDYDSDYQTWFHR